MTLQRNAEKTRAAIGPASRLAFVQAAPPLLSAVWSELGFSTIFGDADPA